MMLQLFAFKEIDEMIIHHWIPYDQESHLPTQTVHLQTCNVHHSQLVLKLGETGIHFLLNHLQLIIKKVYYPIEHTRKQEQPCESAD